MDNPGSFQFTQNGQAFSPLTSAGTIIGDAMTGFGGIDSLTVQAQFAYGTSGGTSVNVYVQTSIDQGQTWFDIMAFGFTTSSAIGLLNVSALDKVVAVVTPGSLVLSLGTAIDGILGDRFRVVASVTGTYLGIPLLNVTGCAR